ncbi:hypothetical protein Ga0466249_004338 [Sporomusaceae bacterium BoRhaA]|nr:hypothetical protein [Pelorhabdus rhamnosifermentans]
MRCHEHESDTREIVAGVLATYLVRQIAQVPQSDDSGWGLFYVVL